MSEKLLALVLLDGEGKKKWSIRLLREGEAPFSTGKLLALVLLWLFRPFSDCEVSCTPCLRDCNTLPVSAASTMSPSEEAGTRLRDCNSDLWSRGHDIELSRKRQEPA